MQLKQLRNYIKVNGYQKIWLDIITTLTQSINLQFFFFSLFICPHRLFVLTYQGSQGNLFYSNIFQSTLEVLFALLSLSFIWNCLHFCLNLGVQFVDLYSLIRSGAFVLGDKEFAVIGVGELDQQVLGKCWENLVVNYKLHPLWLLLRNFPIWLFVQWSFTHLWL